MPPYHLSLSKFRAHLGAALIAAVSAVVMTWPLAKRANDHVLRAIYHWDAYTNAMIMGSRVDAALGRGPLSLYDDYFFAPLPQSIVFNENHFGLSLIFAPFYLVSENPLLAYNLTILISLSLSVFFTFLLVRRLTEDSLAGILAGVAFAFCPYVMFELGRIQLVATQWIPACFFFLHRAIEERRLRDVVGLWFCYLLQVGTCLYYAMFLIPLLALATAVLLYRHRPTLKLLTSLVIGGALSGGIALLMVYPYFTARKGFSLERSLEFAAGYDGKLAFFGHVPPTNLSLTALHHEGSMRGAYEEIAFPGFVVLLLCSLALFVPLLQSIRSPDRKRIARELGYWLTTTALACAATLLTHSFLIGMCVAGAAWGWRKWKGPPLPQGGPLGLYFALLILAVLLFLGLFPFEWRGEPIRGLYYYFHTYFPGFNGIRKVSRQAVMTSFAFAVMASFGSAWLFSKLKRRRHKALLFCAFLGATLFELRSFPHPLKKVWSGDAVPQAYDYIAQLPPNDLVAIAPQNDGVRQFVGDDGMALHNYLALYHKHRFLNGQSSWTLPVTELVRRALRELPSQNAQRVLQILEARHILIHAGDLPKNRRDLPERLAGGGPPFSRVFHEGSDSVFSLSIPDDPNLKLAPVPELPQGAQLVPSNQIKATAQLKAQWAERAVDGNVDSYWTPRRPQARGQAIEFKLKKPTKIIALEIENPPRVFDVPLSYTLSVAQSGSDWQTVATEPRLRIFHEQVYAPKTFLFRIVLPQAILADRLRIAIEEPVPGHYFSIHEARLYQQEDE